MVLSYIDDFIGVRVREVLFENFAIPAVSAGIVGMSHAGTHLALAKSLVANQSLLFTVGEVLQASAWEQAGFMVVLSSFVLFEGVVLMYQERLESGVFR